MRDIRAQIVPDGFSRAVNLGVGLHVGAHVEGAGGEGDDSRIVLGDEFVLGEAFDVEEEIRWERVQEAVALAGVEVFLGLEAVIFGEDGGERDLRNDVLVKLVLEQWGRGEVEGEHEIPRRVNEDLGCLFEAQAVAGVGFGGDLLGFDF